MGSQIRICGKSFVAHVTAKLRWFIAFILEMIGQITLVSKPFTTSLTAKRLVQI